MLKVCHVCGKEKEHKSWKSTTCNDCLVNNMKWCSCCCTIQPLHNFHKNGGTIRSFCKPCEIKRSTESKNKSGYNKRPEVRAKRNEDSRLHKRAKYMFDDEYREQEKIRCHARRDKVDAKCTLTTPQWYDACSAFQNKCAYCGSSRNLTMDHVVPISNGGLTEACNILPVCSSCNSSKQNREFIKWYTSQPFYTEERLEVILKYIESRR